MLATYLGLWNATVPLILLTQFGTGDVVVYELMLSASALLFLPVLASLAERMRRWRAMQLACAAILVTGALRYGVAMSSGSLACWIMIDVAAVAAFALVQPLLGVYAAECGGHERVAFAFRCHRVIGTTGRLAGPLLAGGLAYRHGTATGLACACVLSAAALALSCILRAGEHTPAPRRLSSAATFKDMRLGLQLKWTLPPERFLTFVDVLLGIVLTGIIPLLVPQLVRTAGLPDASVGLLAASYVVGAVVGVLAVNPLLRSLESRRMTFIALWLGMVSGLVTLSQVASIEAMGFALMSVGVTSACLSMIGLDRRTVAIPASGRIRVVGATLLVSQAAGAASYLIYGGLLARSGSADLWPFYVLVLVLAAAAALCARQVWDFLRYPELAQSFYRTRHAEALRDLTSPAR